MADAEKILDNLLNDIAKKANYENYNLEIKNISSEGANYTSKLYLATVSAANKEESLNLFAKVACVGEFLRAQAPMKIYDVERFVYTKLIKIYAKIEDDHIVPIDKRLIWPKCYGYSDKFQAEIIVLEDLTARGFTTYDRFKSVDWEYASKVMEELAKFHALSIACDNDDPAEFESILGAAQFNLSTLKDLKSFLDPMIATALSVTKDENKNKLKTFMEENFKPEDFKKYNSPIRRPVLIHGDFRPSNLMHKKHEDGSLEVMIIDYQTIRVGSPVFDLMYFIFNSSDEAFRAQHYEKLLNHYYEHLGIALKRLDKDPDVLYSRDDFEYELKTMLPYGLFIGVFVLQFVTVEKADAPSFSEDINDLSLKASNTYVERLNGIINDFIKWGLL